MELKCQEFEGHICGSHTQQQPHPMRYIKAYIVGLCFMWFCISFLLIARKFPICTLGPCLPKRSFSRLQSTSVLWIPSWPGTGVVFILCLLPRTSRWLIAICFPFVLSGTLWEHNPRVNATNKWHSWCLTDLICDLEVAMPLSPGDDTRRQEAPPPHALGSVGTEAFDSPLPCHEEEKNSHGGQKVLLGISLPLG